MKRCTYLVAEQSTGLFAADLNKAENFQHVKEEVSFPLTHAVVLFFTTASALCLVM